MTIPLLLRACALSVGLLATYRTSAQTVDPSFQSSEIYYPAQVKAAVFQPDGKRLVVGDFVRTDAGTTSSPLLRYNADNTLDQVFTARVASLRGNLYSVRVLASGQLLLIGDGPLTLGSLTRQDLLRLNADGTPDATFDAGTASGTGRGTVSAVQPDGKIVVGGTFTSYNGATAQRVARLLPDGALDATFSAGTLFDGTVEEIALQPDGKILVGGYLPALDGIVRLLPSGARDNTFASPLYSTRVSVIGLQPDGKILITTGDYQLTLNTNARTSIARLLPNGSIDPAFALHTSSEAVVNNNYDANELLVQPDGRIIATLFSDLNTEPSQGLLRLNSDGTRDLTFVAPLTQVGAASPINSLQRRADGQVLIGGNLFKQAGHRSNILQLTANGGILPDFKPVLLGAGSVRSLVQQPDGKLLVAGRFDEAAGVLGNGLARLNLNGTPDATFASGLPASSSVYKVVLQPDGKMLVGNSVGLVRVLPTGALDNTWQLPATEKVYDFALQPDGRVISTDRLKIKRFMATGQPDNSFAAADAYYATTLLLQPDGKLLVGGQWDTHSGVTSPSLIRLQSNGTMDATFTSPIPAGAELEIEQLRLQPDGKLIAAAYAGVQSPATPPFALFRMQPDGSLDNTFSATVPANTRTSDLALQSNGRILRAAGRSSVLRKLADGQPDATFGAVGNNNQALALLVQADGKILVGGDFNTINGQRALSLVRLSAPNVLRTAPRLVQAPTDLWPNPAHAVLHVQVEAAAQPQQLALLDLTGRVVLCQPITLPDVTLPVQQLKAGVYLLRVDYAEGSVTRRVVVE